MSERHLDTLQLAELAEGLLPEPDADAATSHLDSCPSCQQTAAHLESVTAHLRSAPAALPTPPEVASRLDAAFAAERVGLRHTEGDAREPGSDPVVHIGWFRRRAPQLLAAAAAVGLFGMVGYAVGASVFGADEDMSAVDMDAADAPVFSVEGDQADEAVEESEAARDVEPETLSGPADADDDAVDGADDTAGDDEAMATLAPIEAEVLDLLDIVDDGRETELPAECGRALAADVGLELIGAAPTDILEPGSVLVVVDLGLEPDRVVEGWIVPTCESTAADTLGEPVLVRAG